MHYKNGRTAHLGDLIVYKSWDGNIKCGALFSLWAKQDKCNGMAAPPYVNASSEHITLSECLHVEDAFTLAAEVLEIEKLGTASEISDTPPEPGPHVAVVTKTYSDGTTVTGTPPLPELSPAQQDALDKPTAEITAVLTAGTTSNLTPAQQALLFPENAASLRSELDTRRLSYQYPEFEQVFVIDSTEELDRDAFWSLIGSKVEKLTAGNPISFCHVEISDKHLRDIAQYALEPCMNKNTVPNHLPKPGQCLKLFGLTCVAVGDRETKLCFRRSI